MDEYLGKLCASLADALGHLRPISVVVKADPIQLAPHRALSAGLIVNELVTNAFKYAFPEDRHGTISVALVRQENDTLTLNVSDDGVGKAEGSSAGLGTRLVDVLAAQIGDNAAACPPIQVRPSPLPSKTTVRPHWGRRIHFLRRWGNRRQF